MKNNAEKIVNQLKLYQKRSGFRSANILKEKNWGDLSYWGYRINRPIIKIKYNLFRKRSDNAPWIAPAATLFLKDWLDKEHHMAEFGSGQSTVFFAAKVKEIVSVEHFRPWYDKVNAIFSERNLKNIDYRFITESKNENPGIKELSKEMNSYDSSFKIKESFADYFLALNDKPDGYFDLILVDGRARPECVFASIDKLKPGGLMILDNSERERYKIAFKRLKEWKGHTVSNGLTDTTFWVKPI